MSLGDFYRHAEILILNDIVTYIVKHNTIREPHILNICVSQNGHISEYPFVTNLDINDDPNDFDKNIDKYVDAVGRNEYDIVNCRFSMKMFLATANIFMNFMKFVVMISKPKCVLMGFLLDTNKINGLFSEKPTITGGPYKLEYVEPDEDDLYGLQRVNINDTITHTINFGTLRTICAKFGFVHLDNVILESLYDNSLRHIKLTEYEKLFGFLNYVFLFQKYSA